MTNTNVIPVADAISLHPDLVSKFEASEEASYTARSKAERDIDYYDGKQWTAQEVAELKKRGQPAIAMNEIRPKIDFLQGLEKTQRTVPDCKPRTPAHEQEAHAATDALRFVADDNQYNDKRSKVWQDLLKAGWGGVEIIVEPKNVNQMGTTVMTGPQYEVIVRRTAWDRMFWDMHSNEDDFSDAEYLGLVRWMDKESVIREYGPEAEKVIELTFSGSDQETYSDKPKNTYWVDNQKRKRFRIVQMWCKGPTGEWHFYEFTKGGLLKWGVSPYETEDGGTEHPFVWNSAYIDRDNNRYGPIRDLIDPQDEGNKRRSKALHHATSRQTFGNEKAMGKKSIRDLRKELARPDGHVELQGDLQWGKDFGIIPTNDQSAEHFQLMQQAKQYIEGAGPNAALQGKADENQSGRAILANQQGGAVQMGTLTDTLRIIDYQAFTKIWRRIRQFWTAETWVRVTDDQKNMKWVSVNKPVMKQIQNPYDGQVMEVPEIDPQTGQPVIENNIAELDVDIEISEAPDHGTIQAEEFDKLVSLAQIGIQFPPEIYLAASNLRNKQDLMKMMEEQKQQPNPLQQAAQQLELQGKEAENQKTMADTGKAKADTIATLAKAHASVQEQAIQQVAPQIAPPSALPQASPPQQMFG